MSNKSLSWKSTPIGKIPSTDITWSEDAYLKDGTRVYVMYYDFKTSSMFVDDLRNDVKYEIPKGGKAKGYVLAFKLNKIQ
jgi:hypothetical protein